MRGFFLITILLGLASATLPCGPHKIHHHHHHHIKEGVAYTIKAKISGLYLSPVDVNANHSRVIQVKRCPKDKLTQWIFERKEGTQNHYYIHNALNHHNVLDINGATCRHGEHLIVYPKHGGNNQLFEVDRLDDGSFKITAVHSKQVLDVEGFGRHIGAFLTQWTWHGADNQRFFIEKA